MSNVSYDLDTSGGLMPLIRALIKPPDEDLNVPKPKKPQHPYYKRPGKGHNHDSCDACGEGGELICCDRCPASFHLGCYDPPLDVSDIPAGLWLCRECSAADANRAPSSRGSRAQSPADNKSDVEKKTRSLRNRANSTKKTSKDDKEKSEEKEKEPEEKEKELTPMEALVKAARIMNPKQFELPTDMKISCVFPGTDKEVSSVQYESGSAPAARTCHACERTCRAAPLIQCDYCPLLFHQDCLDPPLTALPTGRWMCPNHVEQYVDWKLVSSVSCSSRAALWARWGAAVEPRAAVTSFLRRARTRNPRFRIKIPVEQTNRVVVPAMVRAHYENPPPLVPARREYVRCRNVMNFLKAGGIYSEPLHEEDNKTAVCMNLDCPQYNGGQCPHVEQAEKLEQDAKVQETSESQSSSDTDSDFEQLATPPKRRRAADECADEVQLGGRLDRERVVRAVQRQLRALDHGLVAMLAWQRLQQVAAGEQQWGRWRGCPVSRGVQALVSRDLQRAPGLDHQLRHAALPSDLLGAEDRERIARCVWGAPRAAPPAPPPRAARPNTLTRALLVPVLPAKSGVGDCLGRATPMRLSRLYIGAGGGCDVILPTDKCRRVSNRHAVIFADEVTGHFELINYSEWGTRVNGVLYACDVTSTDKRTDNKEAHTDEDDNPPAVTALNQLLKDKMPKIEFCTDGVPSCSCRYWSAGGGGGGAGGGRGGGGGGGAGGGGAGGGGGGAWEGSALIPHGAVLQFGCVRYVFCIADVANTNTHQ